MRQLRDCIFEYLNGLEPKVQAHILVRVHWLLDLPCSLFDEPSELSAQLAAYFDAPVRAEREVPVHYAGIGRLLAVTSAIDHAIARLGTVGAAMREAEAALISRDDGQSQKMARQSEFQRHKQARESREPIALWLALRRGPLSPETLALLE